MRDLTFSEIDGQATELLPTKETLFFFKVNYADVYATNSATALQAYTWGSMNVANAEQYVQVNQY
jgi:hypothetical protein